MRVKAEARALPPHRDAYIAKFPPIYIDLPDSGLGQPFKKQIVAKVFGTSFVVSTGQAFLRVPDAG